MKRVLLKGGGALKPTLRKNIVSLASGCKKIRSSNIIPDYSFV